jgi:ATP-binding cassette subfamily E protein 1
MTRIAVVNNEKLKDPNLKRHVMNICPINKAGDECIYMEGDKLRIAENLCIGCGICVKAAPHAINIINLPKELDMPPVHRYGRNGFHLYGLPIPIFGKVVGLIGRNGIGKSTAINVLSGIVKPNLGTEVVANTAQVIEYFKGTEGQSYFEKLRDGNITVSYKLQQVDQIPHIFTGTVREFLHKVSKNDAKILEISKDLAIDSILDSSVDVISGGELQRTAIAAAVLKDANVYFFDEPTSFLDIKQRMNVAQFIRNLSQKKTADGKEIAIVVIEHDLIILDYLTDLVHTIYGKENVYGVVAAPQTAKTGINTYLKGYLRHENVRFRDYEIKFPERSEKSTLHREHLISWENITKKLGSFSLVAEKGTIMKKDIVGVLGENGIGKTTFMKMLAGVHAPDTGKTTENISVSYKPQYIKTDSEDLVITHLARAIEKYKSMLIRPLDLEPILMMPLNQLSGGQLQRVSIAHALSQEAHVYLLDEPSAYLDVEQRLIISKVIRDIMELSGKTAVVIDHDLLFIDYISDSIAVFEGVPSKEGIVKGPFGMQEAMNLFLSDVAITYRRDPESHRPRANKLGSQMDQEQKSKNKYYYT